MRSSFFVVHAALVGMAVWGIVACSSAGTSSGATATPDAGADARVPVPASPLDPMATQLVTVVSADWASIPATLQRYEAGEPLMRGAWNAVGDAIPVVLGKSGLGWGIGLHSAASTSAGDGPVKHEGDGRSPAGAFSLGTAFGYATPADATWLKLPYVQATTDLECVDDPASSHYNTLVHRSTVPTVDWNSSEVMKRSDSAYRWGLFVDHNSDPPKAGAGSCIFVHLWSDPASSTVGCTAGEEAKIKELLGWLDPAKHPLLVQLPQAAYDAHKADWALP
jgi:D-alanyl-D-alanine dipeptidase